MVRFVVKMNVDPVELQIVAETQEEAIEMFRSKLEDMLVKHAHVSVETVQPKTLATAKQEIADLCNKLYCVMLDKGIDTPGDDWIPLCQVQIMTEVLDYMKDGGITFDEAYAAVVKDDSYLLDILEANAGVEDGVIAECYKELTL